MFNPYSPTSTPAKTIPMMYGMRSRPIMMGDNKIIINTTKNINVGSVIGKYWAI